MGNSKLSIQRCDVQEAIVWVWDCPNCNYPNTTDFDPASEEEYCCDDCNECIKLED